VFKPNEQLKQLLTQRTSVHLAAMSAKGGSILKERLSREWEERTGITFYSEQGVFSSTPEQYPQEVRGKLMESAGSDKIDDLSYRVGVGILASSEQPQRALDALNYGRADGSRKGNFFMQKTFDDEQVRQEMLEAVAP
jgi:hypothetical protein